MRIGGWAGTVSGPIIALLLSPLCESAAQASAKSKPRPTVASVQQAIEKETGNVQTVTFPDTEWRPVKIIRGGAPAKDTKAEHPPAERAETAEIVSFGSPNGSPVRVVRGETAPAATLGQTPRASSIISELVSFADPRYRPVTVLRGSGAQSLPGLELFAPAREPDLDRVAFAVDGAESSHGADLRMWRPEPSGPQGPMQVSAAAAADIGGGDRFDMTENRQLGRAYLAHLYRHYGNWPDAIAAYNWGPGNMDSWISNGRPSGAFPLEVERYRDRVLRDLGFDWTFHRLLTYGDRLSPRNGQPLQLMRP
jgi:Transglycosylase SLT domain